MIVLKAALVLKFMLEERDHHPRPGGRWIRCTTLSGLGQAAVYAVVSTDMSCGAPHKPSTDA